MATVDQEMFHRQLTSLSVEPIDLLSDTLSVEPIDLLSDPLSEEEEEEEEEDQEPESSEESVSATLTDSTLAEQHDSWLAERAEAEDWADTVLAEAHRWNSGAVAAPSSLSSSIYVQEPEPEPEPAEAAAGAAAVRSEEDKKRKLHWLDFGVWPQASATAAGAATSRSEEEKRRRLHWLDFRVWPQETEVSGGSSSSTSTSTSTSLSTSTSTSQYSGQSGHNKRSCPEMAMRLYRRIQWQHRPASVCAALQAGQSASLHQVWLGSRGVIALVGE